MTAFSYAIETPDARPRQLGLIVLETDETIERDARRLVPGDVDLLVSRVPFATEVTPETLQAMADHLAQSASLFPRAAQFASVGYGCTSGTAQIGPPRIAELVVSGCQAEAVSEPVTALIAACDALRIRKLAFLSPYVEAVSARLRQVLADSGIACPTVGTFDEPDDSRVARIPQQAVHDAATALLGRADMDCVDVDGLFLSCTNLQTLDVIPKLEEKLDMPVLASNQVLVWHMLRLAGIPASRAAPGRLWHVL